MDTYNNQLCAVGNQIDYAIGEQVDYHAEYLGITRKRLEINIEEAKLAVRHAELSIEEHNANVRNYPPGSLGPANGAIMTTELEIGLDQRRLILRERQLDLQRHAYREQRLQGAGKTAPAERQGAFEVSRDHVERLGATLDRAKTLEGRNLREEIDPPYEAPAENPAAI